MIGYRDACAPADVSFPAAALRDARVARWLREQRMAVDVRTLAELHSAISVGIHPGLMTVHAEQLDGAHIRRARAAGVGRVVLSRPHHVAAFRPGRTQNVLLRMTDPAPGNDSAAAADAVIGCRSTRLIGLSGEIGAADDSLVSTPRLVSDMIAQMDDIRRRHRIVLTRLIVGVGDAVAAEACSVVCRDLAEMIGDSVDDACATMRFPRPVIVLAM